MKPAKKKKKGQKDWLGTSEVTNMATCQEGSALQFTGTEASAQDPSRLHVLT